jgi:hypothetical protein
MPLAARVAVSPKVVSRPVSKRQNIQDALLTSLMGCLLGRLAPATGVRVLRSDTLADASKNAAKRLADHLANCGTVKSVTG